ncbi:Inner membrane protein YbiR [hydrothermal vent metagenome]|uniref:Inner membrane protein YbiR n=1 Tax=hydrothermal vent metagenome TaxID=652676 RepID=A0A3B1BXA0_9ZZZZ
MVKSVLNKNNYIFLPFLILLMFSAFIYPSQIKNYFEFIDWRTITVLISLLITTTAIKESSFFIKTTERLIYKIDSEKKLALTLIILSSILSMFFTNDIALFIVVPLTLTFQTYLQNNLQKLIIFEAISVNVGASLTPIGSPQNLFLWHQWNISFVSFVGKMLPLFSLLFILLILFSLIIFPSRKLSIKEFDRGTVLNKKLFYISIPLLLLCVISVELSFSFFAMLVIFFIYLFFFKEILLKVDWLLILLFIIMFIDFHIVSQIPFVSSFITQFDLNNPGSIFTLSLFSAQMISNVPASIFMSKFSHDWFAIAYGVNVGANGFIIGSLANIIALRFINTKKIWIDFHKYSIPYFAVTAVLAYIIFF